MRIRLLTALGVAAAFALGLAACGGGGSSSGGDTASVTTTAKVKDGEAGGTPEGQPASGGGRSMAQIATCFKQSGVKVTAEVNEIEAGYEEVAGVGVDGNLMRVYRLEEPSRAREVSHLVEKELEKLRPTALAIAEPVPSTGGRYVYAVAGNEEVEEKGTEFFPSETDEAIAIKCAR